MTDQDETATGDGFHDPAMGAFVRFLGIRITEWSADHVVLAMAVRPEMLNRSDVLHGGIVASLIDTACGYAGLWVPPGAPPLRALTLSLTTQFTGQAGDGEVRALGHKKGGGKTTYFAEAEILDENEKLIGFGSATLRYRQSGTERSGPGQTPSFHKPGAGHD
ncbi:MAG: PaaI family thioesterase [Geminicoccaceae bacterium]